MLEPRVPESFQSKPYARRHFQAIARWAARNHPFYAARVHGDAPAFAVLTREEVQAGNGALLNGFEATACTSGSTSMPVKVSWSPQRAAIEQRDIARFVHWLGGRLPSVRIVSMSAHAADEHTMEVTEPVAAQVELILRRHALEGACAIVTYPSNLELLCRHVLEQGLDLGFVRRVVCMSECCEPWHDALVAQAFPGAVATSTYSSMELGLIAARCPHRPANYHVMAGKLGVEFLRPDGSACEEGELGQVVVTDYWNRRSTLIRYALGDYAAPVTCDCGRIDGPAMTNVVGMVRGVLKDATGRPLLFTGFSPMLRDCPEIRQFQVLQPALRRFVVRYVAREGAALGPFRERVGRHFEARLGPGVEIEFEPVASIPRSAGGKFHGAICLA